MLKQFLNHIEQHQLLTKSDRVLLAVSGGLDSMVMTHLFLQAEITFGVAHCNFQLRGKESDGDEQFINDFCSQHEIPFHTNRFDTKSYAETNGISTQMAARQLRYAWFEELLEAKEYNSLATAHHLNDSIETVLMNWIHGSSIDGLSGIPVKNDKIIRPLLFATREEIHEYAQGNQINWREDTSNLTTDYQRNFIRHKIIPLLKEINPSLEVTAQRNITKIKEEGVFIESAFEDWKKKYVIHSPEKIVIDKNGFQKNLNASVLWRLIRHLGFNYDTCVNIMEAMHGQPGKKFIGPSHNLVVDRDKLILYPQVDFWKAVRIKQDQPKALLGSWNLKIDEVEVQKPESNYEAVLDADKIQFPLQWRQWKPGDVFYPLGMNHRKKVSDFLIDEKVSVADKASVTVLESNGNIIWLVGHRIDNRYKITGETKRAISFKLTPYFV